MESTGSTGRPAHITKLAEQPNISSVSNLDIPELLDNLESSLTRLIQERNFSNPVAIGIHTGGVWIAQEMCKRLKITEPLGVLDIAFYRDDFSQIGIQPTIRPSQLPVHLEGRDIILIDDVFFSGRTARAALNEIFDYGRPNQVLLAVLIERNGRQIPLRPDCRGLEINLPLNQRIKLTGPTPLAIETQIT